MFERFSTASRKAVFCARWEAGFVGSEIIDSEHLLLGLLRVDPTTLQYICQAVTLISVREAALRWHVPGKSCRLLWTFQSAKTSRWLSRTLRRLRMSTEILL